jgi:hypothetical protein
MTIRTKHTELFIVATLLAVMPSVALTGASTVRDSARCTRIDQNRTAQFISYEGISEGTSYSDVRLKLHNNSSCPITIETDDHDPFMLRGEKHVALHYLLYDRRHAALKPGYGWGDSVFTVTIGGGDSVNFTVPLARLRKGFNVAVPFNFEWDGNDVDAGAIGGVKHHVFFLVDDVLPKTHRRE